MCGGNRCEECLRRRTNELLRKLHIQKVKLPREGRVEALEKEAKKLKESLPKQTIKVPMSSRDEETSSSENEAEKSPAERPPAKKRELMQRSDDNNDGDVVVVDAGDDDDVVTKPRN